MKVPPMPSAHLFLNLGEPVRLWDADPSVPPADLAHTAGYFDRAHFSREFKDFTGHTPTEYLALRRRFPAEPGFPPDDGPMPAD
jgi:AraC-like DNA-binding protein